MSNEANEEATLRKIVHKWADKAAWDAPHLPCDYLVLDVETTGFSSVNNRIVSVGLCLVEDCRISKELYDGNSSNIILKWPEDVFYDAEKAIAIHGIDYDKSQQLGIEPGEAMGIIDDAVQLARDRGMSIVGHNFTNFDAQFIEQEMSRAGIDNKFTRDEVIDTHVLTKAMQLGMIPGDNETVYDYMMRVVQYRARGVYSNLDRYCMERFDLQRKYGANAADAHDSGYDCWLTHLVFRELNKITGFIYEEDAA